MKKLYDSKKLVIQNSRDLEIEYKPFSFKRDHITIIRGESGIGKSTLLNILGLLNANFGGESHLNISLNGSSFNLAEAKESQREEWRRKYFSYILQEDHLVDAMSVRDNIFFPSYFNNNSKQLMGKLEELLKHDFLKPVGKRLDRSSAVLSGGEKKKVALVRAMLKEHEVLIADEPWTSLGEGDVDKYTDFFIQERKGKSTVLATHDDRVIDKFLTHHGALVDLVLLKEVKKGGTKPNGILRKVKLTHTSKEEFKALREKLRNP